MNRNNVSKGIVRSVDESLTEIHETARGFGLTRVLVVHRLGKAVESQNLIRAE